MPMVLNANIPMQAFPRRASNTVETTVYFNSFFLPHSQAAAAIYGNRTIAIRKLCLKLLGIAT